MRPIATFTLVSLLAATPLLLADPPVPSRPSPPHVPPHRRQDRPVVAQAPEVDGQPATRQAATKPATIAEAKAMERKDLLDNTKGSPVIGPYEMPQVLNIHVDNKRVVVSSPLPSYDGERVIQFRHGGDDSATIDFHSMSPSAAADQPRFIQFLRYDLRDPSVVFFHTMVQAHPGYTQISGAWQFLEGMRDVSIIDQEEKLDDAGGQEDASITLRVQGLDDNENVTHKVELTAPDLKTLLREHPSEVNEYLRPVLRELGAESLLDVDPTMAWQVFSAEAKPDPAIAAKVNELLPKLDANNFADREAAADALKKLGPAAAVALLKVDRSKLSPEQNQRLEEVLAPYQQLTPLQAEKLGQDPAFLLTAMDSDDPDLRRVALARLDKKLGRQVAIDLNAPPDERRAAVEALRKQLLPPAATQVVEKPAQ